MLLLMVAVVTFNSAPDPKQDRQMPDDESTTYFMNPSIHTRRMSTKRRRLAESSMIIAATREELANQAEGEILESECHDDVAKGILQWYPSRYITIMVVEILFCRDGRAYLYARNDCVKSFYYSFGHEKVEKRDIQTLNLS